MAQVTPEKIDVEVFLPSLLANSVDGKESVVVSGATLSECLDDLVARFPLLEVHLFEQGRQLRGHVNLFYNDTNARWLEDWNVAVSQGDTLTILQAVSGG